MNFYILAGGRSRRMRQNKALLKVNGGVLIEKIIDAVPAKAGEIKIVTNSPDEYSFLPHIKIRDIYPHRGPISGIHAGLVDAGAEFSFFLACDLPFISHAVIAEIVHRHGGQAIFGVKTADGLQPLCSIYSKSCVPVIESMIADGHYSLHDLFKKIESEFIEMKGLPDFFNLNTLDDWHTFLTRQKHHPEHKKQ